ncbi:MAG: patatin-like phospholipase family protein [Bacteroidales bacterium]|nr:patatin-like phospholipase family protein [Bacteroidales bacterium]
MPKRIAIVILLIFNISIVYPQRVAVVLSGGGAYGTAHIGFLRALEENNIPIDYIAGTSAGAIIGGLYAAGYTIEEIERFFLSGEVQKISLGKIETDDIFAFYAPPPSPTFLPIKFDIKNGKLKHILPNNLRSPSKMDYRFMTYFSGASAASNYQFDSLMIPFRCVASDIDSNRSYVFSQGNLGNAIRASMSMPLFFKPVEIDGKILFDGGMYNNFPVDVAQDTWQPDIIIGCKSVENFKKPESEDVISQLQNILMNNTNFNIDSSFGILIEPNLNKVDILDFSDTQHYIDSGYIATKRSMEKITSRINRRSSPIERSEKRASFKNKIPPPNIDTITFIGVNEKQAQFIRKQLRTKYSSHFKEEFRKDYFRLLQSPHISSIYPQMIYDQNLKKWNLILNVKIAPHYNFDIGGALSTDISSNLFLQFSYLHLAKQGFRWSINGYVGLFYRSVNANFKTFFSGNVPVSLELDATANFYRYYNKNGLFFINETPSNFSENNNNLIVKCGIPIKNNTVLYAGAGIGYDKSKYFQNSMYTRVDTTDLSELNYFSPFIQYEVNNLNKIAFPYAGRKLSLQGLYVFGNEIYTPGTTADPDAVKSTIYKNWFQVNLNFENYFRITRWFRLGLSVDAAMSNQPLFSNYMATMIEMPEFAPTVHLKTFFIPELRAPIFTAVGGKLIFPVFNDHLNFRAGMFVFQPYQEVINKGNLKPELSKPFPLPKWLLAGSITYHTMFGPLSLTSSYVHNIKDPFSIALSFGYILFNKTLREP